MIKINEKCGFINLINVFGRWNYIQVGKKLYKNMDRIVAFERGLKTWGEWLDANVDPTKTMVFFQGISPNHYKYAF